MKELLSIGTSCYECQEYGCGKNCKCSCHKHEIIAESKQDSNGSD